MKGNFFFSSPSKPGLLLFLLSMSLFTVKAQPTLFDSVTVSIAPGYDSASNFHRFWLGEGYRKLWATPVTLKVFDLQQEKGGLTPVELGGGLQTRSLRLKDAAGKSWVLRSVQKYPERGLPENLQNTIAKRILQDQVITVHPFGALTVPPLAKALGLAHTNPQIVWVKDDPALGAYRTTFANTVLLFEERGAIDTFRTISTETLQAELEGTERASVDQRKVLRARLLDMLLGDWDRHEGQWRWEAKKEGNKTVYGPVPHDRDYVFYNTTGVLPWLVASQWQTARFQGFDESIENIETYNFNNRFFDRYFLNSLDEEDWQKEIAFVQQTLTDDVLQKAVSQMPFSVYKISGEEILQTLKKRKTNLAKDAMIYYRFLTETVDVPATAGSERLLIKPETDGHVLVTVIPEKENADGAVYKRRFDPLLTKEIRLYGLGGNDRFELTGNHRSPIRIRMVGGNGKDEYSVPENYPNGTKTYVYDQKGEENKIAKGLRLRLSRDSAAVRFDRRNFQYNYSIPTFNLFYNIDQRSFFTVGYAFQKAGFRKEPYASRHEVVAGYSPVRGSFLFRYVADWRKVWGPYGFLLDLLSLGPKNLSNFFGTGNETTFPNGGGKTLSFYRNRYDLVTGDFRLQRFLSSLIAWNAGVSAQYYTSKQENNKLRFLEQYNQITPGEEVFSTKVHAGVGAGLLVDTRRNSLLPSNGVILNLDAKALSQVDGEKKNFAALRGDLSFFLRLTRDSGIVLVNRLGGGATIGDPYFYQMPQLGGRQNLRGYNINRFTGRSMAYHNAELRMKLFNFTSFLFPGTFGVIGFHDVGRVWMPQEKSGTWHSGYGGGIFVVPANVITLQALVGKSKESTQLYVNFAFGL